jgi:hypothetical protein
VTETQSAPGGAPDQNQTTQRPAKRRKLAAAEREPEKIRVELNIEKWPGIWQPAKAHTKVALRTLERHVELRNGDRATSKLLIGFTELGTLTTEDQKTFYALIHQWENSGKPVGRPVYFSDRLLSRLLKKKGWGTNVIQSITGSLRRLRTTPLRWIKSFHKNDSVGQEYEEEIPFQLLDDLKIVTRRSHGHVTNQQGYFQFNRHIETNLQANYTKPLLEEVFFGLESEIAQLIYTHIDLVMFGKTRYERCTKELFADLGLTGASYRFKSNRKQKLQRALVELRGIRLNHGILKSANIEETVDGHDYKVVFTKITARPAEVEAGEAATLPESDGIVVNHYAQVKDAHQTEAEELVRYFHKIFHGEEAHELQLKETNQALTLVSRYGLEKAKHLVDFVRVEAGKTNFQVQHFGAVINYTSRGIADFEHSRSRTSVRPLRQPVISRPATLAPSSGERRLALLTPQQFLVRFELAKAEVFKQIPFLAQHAKSNSRVQEQTIRAHVVRTLEAELMDLAPMNLLPDWFRWPKSGKRDSQNLPL